MPNIYEDDCERCGVHKAMECHRGPLPENHHGLCMECGFTYSMRYYVLSLPEVNHFREAKGMEPLSKLREPRIIPEVDYAQEEDN